MCTRQDCELGTRRRGLEAGSSRQGVDNRRFPVTYIALMLLTVGLLAFFSRRRHSRVSVAIMKFARSMDATPMYARNAPRKSRTRAEF
jgi:hypothetical protein